MKKVIIILLIILLILSLIFISFFVFKKEEEKENKNISVILETEEGNIESNTFPNKNDYEYLSTECKNTSDNINTTFNEETWKLNLNVEEERIDGKFNCTVHFKENIKPNEPVLGESMVPVYYSDADSTWKVADKDNKSTEHKWYDYEEKMWANSVTYDHTKLIDLSSKNNDVTFSGPSYNGDGINFDGVNDNIDVGYENYDFNNKLTLIARFKSDSYTETGGVLIGNYGTNGTVTGFELYVGAGIGRIVLQFFNKVDGTNERVSVTSGGGTELNKWYTAVGTYDGSTMKVYVDGELKGEKKLTPEEMNGINSSAPIYLGSNPYNNGIHFFPGTISDAIVINDVLTEEEIKENYSREVNYKENDKTLFAYDLQGYEGREAGSIVPMEMIETMQVWIPRYKYKIYNFNSAGENITKFSPTEIKFEKGTNTTGKITCVDNIQGEDGDGTSETCTLNGEECTDNLCNGVYYTHPAFTFGDKELEGIWVGKFEASAEENTECYKTPSAANCNKIIQLKTVPDVISVGAMNMSNMFDSIKQMNSTNNVYGFTKNEDVHMIKLKEWGAVSLFSRSNYGTVENGVINHVYKNNSSSHYTGRSGAVLNETANASGTYRYNEIGTGTKASTTHNIYGIYDMVGGSWEAVMANIVGPDGKTRMSGFDTGTGNSGYSGLAYDSGNYTEISGKNYPEDKYIDMYSYGTASDLKRGKLGHGDRENPSNMTVYAEYPWILKGGMYSTASIYLNGAGVFSGSSSSLVRSTRIVITN